MTFVVARQDRPGGVLRVVADMRLTDPAEMRRGFPYAVLKNIILSPDVVVAYAGNSELALHTIRENRDLRGIALLEKLGHSSELAGEGPGGVDYLVADTQRGIQKVSAAGVEEPAQSGWIGERDAFEAYQRAFHEVDPPAPIWIEGISPPKEELSDPSIQEGVIRMAHAIHALNEGETVSSVGEAFIWASSRDGFRYDQQGMFIAYDEQEIGTEWTDIHWGTAAKGSFGFNTLQSREAGVGVIGFYFPHAGLGLLYHPLAYDEAVPYRRLTHEEFRNAVRADHGLDIDGPRLS